MLQLNKNYKLGGKTFWLFYFRHGKLLSLFIVGLCYLAWAIYLGPLRLKAEEWLFSHYSYVTIDMLVSWILMLAFSLLVVILLETWVIYRQYVFRLDEHALRIKKGIFNIKEIVLPYHHIQNVEIKRPYLYSFLGLVTIDIIVGNNATYEHEGEKNKHREASMIPVLDKKIAAELSKELIRRGVDGGESLQDAEPSLKKRRRRR